ELVGNGGAVFGLEAAIGVHHDGAGGSDEDEVDGEKGTDCDASERDLSSAGKLVPAFEKCAERRVSTHESLRTGQLPSGKSRKELSGAALENPRFRGGGTGGCTRKTLICS